MNYTTMDRFGELYRILDAINALHQGDGGGTYDDGVSAAAALVQNYIMFGTLGEES